MGDGFNEEYFDQLAQIEENHFWFRSRERLIVETLKKYFPATETFLEIGCGTGFMLSKIEHSFPDWTLWGGELFSEGLGSASQRVKKASLLEMDAREIPFDREMDVIGAFDVIEHISEDREVLTQIHKALKPGGGVILTVPQHTWLWSSWDELSYHQRRYSRKELTGKLEAAGFRRLWSTSFFTFLLPVMMLSRLRGNKGTDLRAEFHINAALNRMFEKVCSLERSLLTRGLSLPAGGSLLYVAVKD